MAESEIRNIENEETKKNSKAENGGTAEEGIKYDAMSVEETFEALDSLIESLETGEGSLEDAFKSYEEGMKLVKSCNDKIDRIEKQVLILSGEQAEDEEDVVYFR